MDRAIAHVDMDAFFVSVELARRPELRGKPVVVATGTDPRARGVVMAASYEARAYGVHSALPLQIAHRRCPDAILLPRNFDAYQRASRKVMAVLGRFSDRVEVAGLDEAYVDLSASPVPQARAHQIKRDIRTETDLTASVGLAPNKLLAKIASDLDKPDGFFLLRPEDMLAAVGAKPASIIPGVGPKTAERLQALGVGTVAELAGADPAKLEPRLGPNLARSLIDSARGIDHRPVQTERIRKSESRETTFAADVDDPAVLRETVVRLAGELAAGLSAGGRAGRTVTLKIRLRPFRTHTRSRTLAAPTDSADLIAATAAELLAEFPLDAPVRLLGVGLSSLDSEPPAPAEEPRQARLALASD